MAAVASHDSIALTADEGDADDREKDRDAQNQCTIHPKFLHKTGTVPYGDQPITVTNFFPLL